MKICFINNLYGANARGGAEKIIERLATTLITRGYQISVISGAVQTGVSYKEQLGVKLIFLPSQYQLLNNKSFFYKIFFHFFSFFNIIGARRLGKIIKQERPDLIWTHNLVGLNLLSFKFLGTAKKIHTFHDIQLLHPSGLMFYQFESLLNSFSAKIYQALVRLVFPKNILGIFPSVWLKDLYKQYNLLPANNLVLKNPLESKNLINPEVGERAKFSFLYLGQLEPHKGVELLIKSFLKLNNTDINLIIAGTGSLETKLKNDYQENSSIIFLGKVESAQQAFKQADCLVVPSLCYENLPTVALEANAYELPTIGSNLGGVAEAIGDERLLFEPSEEKLISKLAWCLANKQELKELAKLARQKVKIPDTSSYLEEVGKMIKLNF